MKARTTGMTKTKPFSELTNSRINSLNWCSMMSPMKKRDDKCTAMLLTVSKKGWEFIFKQIQYMHAGMYSIRTPPARGENTMQHMLGLYGGNSNKGLVDEHLNLKLASRPFNSICEVYVTACITCCCGVVGFDNDHIHLHFDNLLYFSDNLFLLTEFSSFFPSPNSS